MIAMPTAMAVFTLLASLCYSWRVLLSGCFEPMFHPLL
jgi:hypothetical protein